MAYMQDFHTGLAGARSIQYWLEAKATVMFQAGNYHVAEELTMASNELSRHLETMKNAVANDLDRQVRGQQAQMGQILGSLLHRGENSDAD